jgi:peptide deformylase
MSKLKIIKFGNPVLRQVAKPVTVFHRKLHQLIDAMAETLERRSDGAALAAPQVDVLKRVVVIHYENEYLELINPQITAYAGEQVDYEGCLSFFGYLGMVPRHETVTVQFVTRYGEPQTIERQGRMARCIQHELDHLDGVLFIDRMDTDHLIHPEKETKIPLQTVLDLANGKSKNIATFPK